jgi:hypothetical protein
MIVHYEVSSILISSFKSLTSLKSHQNIKTIKHIHVQIH